MKRRRGAASLASNPVLVGAVTVLVTITAVFLSYNANSGLPFVPTFELRVVAPDAARLVVGNEVREGGERIGQITAMETVEVAGGQTAAELTLKLDDKVSPIPEDSTILIRPRSTLGLKYVDLLRGRSGRPLVQGDTLRIDTGAVPPEFDDFFSMFDERTRQAVKDNLDTFGGGFAGRGLDLNRALEDLPSFLGNLVPVMQTLAAPSTRLRAFVTELADAARITVPVADDLADGFRSGADVFEALSRDPQALRDFIGESPATLQAGIEELPRQRPFLQRLAAISDEVRGTAREIRLGAAPLSRALLTGTRVLPDTPPLNRRLAGALESLRELAAAPTTDLVIRGLQSTMASLNPTLRWVGPHITVCNYWNHWWTTLSDHIAEQVPTGTVQRIQVKTAPLGTNTLNSFHATGPVQPSGADPASIATMGDPAALHAQPYGRAVDESGSADCEQGQRGYPLRLMAGAPPGLFGAVDPRTPGNQGTTFKGRARVPDGQTFSAEPTGLAPRVVP